MSFSSSSSTNESLPDIFNTTLSYCFISGPSSFIFITYTLTSFFLVLPMCIFILYHGLQQWWQNPSTSSAAAQSNSFTYHMVAMELISVSGTVLCCCAAYKTHFITLFVGQLCFTCTWYGKTFFHILTCVERYLAVVHPITYMNLRNDSRTRFKNASIVFAWLFSFVGLICFYHEYLFIVMDFCLLILSLFIVMYCSLAVLCVLIRPRPGKKGGGRKRVDQSKQKAFYTIVAILGVLVVKFAWNLTCAVLFFFEGDTKCIVMMCFLLFNLPSSLVLPLLFLQREGKLF